ncbi:MAG: hypothetical protein WDO13_08680 [Verrucomicrobiota bacterium]
MGMLGCAGFGALTANAQDATQAVAPTPPALPVTAPSPQDQGPVLPVDIYKKNDKGVVVVAVQFDGEGRVANCRVIRSNAPFPLEMQTIDHIKRKWLNEFFAGTTQIFPIEYDEIPWYAKRWDDHLVPPPNLLPPGDPGRTMKVRVTFGKDGWVTGAQVVEPSGIQVVDEETAIWVKVHWHNEAYAGQVLDAPFEFKAPPAPKVVAPPKPKPEPAPSAEPAEPAAVPATRVE